jgi:hypothetical protein
MRRSNLRTINEAAKTATASRYKYLPALPSQLTLVGWLRELNANLDGPDTIRLYCESAGWVEATWSLGDPGKQWPSAPHSEELPGDGKPFDAPAAARRLLSEARQAGFR